MYSILTLVPDTPEWNRYLALAWSWVNEKGRDKFFPHTGGGLSMADYFTEAAKPLRKHFAVLDGEQPISLITVEVDGTDEYLFHVTSPRKASTAAITAATYNIGWQLFDKLQAQRIYTMVPTFNGHTHIGSRALALACGLRPYGVPEEEDINGWHYNWQTYSMTREDWLENHYGKKERS